MLGNALPLFMLGELLDEPEEMSIANGLGGLDLIHLAVEGGPAQALRLVDGISNAAIRSEALAALECLTDGSVIGALPLAMVRQAMSLAWSAPFGEGSDHAAGLTVCRAC